MTPLAFILALGIIGTVVLWAFELYSIRSIKEGESKLEEVTNNFIDAFDQTKNVINVNASSLRTVQDVVSDHDKELASLHALFDVVWDSLSINPDLRRRIETNIQDHMADIQGLKDEDEQPDDNGSEEY